MTGRQGAINSATSVKGTASDDRVRSITLRRLSMPGSVALSLSSPSENKEPRSSLRCTTPGCRSMRVASTVFCNLGFPILFVQLVCL